MRKFVSVVTCGIVASAVISGCGSDPGSGGGFVPSGVEVFTAELNDGTKAECVSHAYLNKEGLGLQCKFKDLTQTP